jgi:hypothetical protein
MAIFVGKHVFKCVEGEEPYGCFEGVSNHERGAADIVLPSKGWKGLLQGTGKSSIELQTSFCKFRRILNRTG